MNQNNHTVASSYEFCRVKKTIRNRTVLAAMTNKQSYNNGIMSKEEIDWLTVGFEWCLNFSYSENLALLLSSLKKSRYLCLIQILCFLVGIFALHKILILVKAQTKQSSNYLKH